MNADVGALDVVFLDEADPHGSPLGSKGIGELGICGAGAAVINAIHNATGARIRDIPATPDKLLAALAALDGVLCGERSRRSVEPCGPLAQVLARKAPAALVGFRIQIGCSRRSSPRYFCTQFTRTAFTNPWCFSREARTRGAFAVRET